MTYSEIRRLDWTKMIWRGGNEVDAIVGGWVTDGKWLTSDDEMSGKDDSR